MTRIKKSTEISDAKIQFVSLVDKAANKREFLITKAENGTAQFFYSGKILKVDDTTHYITGIVYEPLAADTDDNFMTEEEIRKAAYWFAKNGDKIDVQHSFEAVDGVTVVENYVTPCDMEIGDTPIVKGTWLMTVEVTNTEIWDAVQKGNITGFSMGGVGKYSKEDIDLADINKTADTKDVAEKKGLIKKFAEMLGIDVVEKSAMTDAYERQNKSSSFWNAFYALEDILYHYNSMTDRWEFESDDETIKEVLTDFSQIVQEVLSEKSITKALIDAAPVNKAGKKISSANKEKLESAYQALSELREELSEDEEESIEKEEFDLNKQEIQELIDGAIKKALEKNEPEPAAGTGPADGGQPEPASEVPTTEEIQKMIEDSIAKAVDPILKHRNIPSNLNDEPQPIEKSSGLFDGFFI